MVLFSMTFGRTELIRSVSKAKFDEEADGEVHWHPNLQKPDEKYEELFRIEMFRQFFFRRRNMKRWESSELFSRIFVANGGDFERRPLSF